MSLKKLTEIIIDTSKLTLILDWLNPGVPSGGEFTQYFCPGVQELHWLSTVTIYTPHNFAKYINSVTQQQAEVLFSCS